MAAKADNGEESDGLSTSSEPPDWNSDDEPPQDQEGDEHTCSRDGAVKRTICKVGRGLERPGQYDFVRVRVEGLQLDSEDIVQPTGQLSAEVLNVQMGQDQLPLAVEFAVKSMRVGEIAEVRGPAAYSIKASPLTGRRLRSQAGVLPKQPSKVPRSLRFTPVAPQVVALKAKADLDKTNKARADAAQRGSPPPASIKPPMYRAQVELLELQCVHMLTEDQSVSKRLVQAGRSRRQPRLDDVVTFSLKGPGTEEENVARYTLRLGDDKLPYPGLRHVLLSMKEDERCIARLSSVADRDCTEHRGIVELDVTLHRWRRRDLVPMPPIADLEDSAAASGDLQSGYSSSSSSPVTYLRKIEIHPGPERKDHDIEAGSLVFVGLAPDSAHSLAPMLLSWRIGEGTVPRYLEAAVTSMRLGEGSFFEAPEAARAWPLGPSYDGQTPLRKLHIADLELLLTELLAWGDADEQRLGSRTSNTEDGQGKIRVPGDANDAKLGTHHEQPYQLPSDWAALGDPQNWDELPMAKESCFRLVLLDASEALEICLLEDADQMRFLELERAHGNALARSNRFSEALVAYSRALDTVRRTAFYKALFPTERGHIQGAYSRDAGEVEKPVLEGLTPEELSARQTSLVALHLNLSLCAFKAGKYFIARRHADTALGAEPENAKALFRRGQAAAGQGDFEDALSDLRRAAKMMPQDCSIRAELDSVQQKLLEHKDWSAT